MSDVENQAGEQGNAGASEQSNSDAAANQQPNDQSSQQPQQSGESTSPNGQTGTADTTASGASSQSTSQPEAGNGQAGASSDSAGTTSPATSAPGTDSSNSPSTPTNPTIVTGQVVNGNVTTPVAPAAPVTPDVPAVVNLKKEESVVLDSIQTGISDVDQVVEKLMQNASIEAKIIINTIKDYIVTMKPGKPVAQKVAIGQQVAFYNAILSAINNLEGDFRPTLQSILALMHAHKDGAFKETHVFRYIESVPLSTDHRAGWRKLTTLLKTLANPATRQDLLRQMNFDPLVKHGLSERGRTKLAAFFGK